MDWININEDLPENGTLCWVFVPRKEILLRVFQEDSFNLGDDDYQVTHWQPFSKPQYPDIHDLRQNPESISLAVGHKVVCFSGLSRNLA